MLLCPAISDVANQNHQCCSQNEAEEGLVPLLNMGSRVQCTCSSYKYAQILPRLHVWHTFAAH